jgi:hypothetical protein
LKHQRILATGSLPLKKSSYLPQVSAIDLLKPFLYSRLAVHTEGLRALELDAMVGDQQSLATAI